MNKLKSFTIIELMVVMLISTMVMAITYQGYMLFNKQFISFKNSSEVMAHVSLLDRLLCSDISDCNALLKKSKGVDCLFKNSVIQYEWEEKFILRKQGVVIDTFHLHSQAIEFNFLGKQSMEGQLVDELIFIEQNNEQHRSFHYAKKYGADILVNNR